MSQAEIVKQKIDQFDREETEAAAREEAADAEQATAKAAADAEFQNDLQAAIAKRSAAYVAADAARKQKRDATVAANAERTTEVKAAMADAYVNITANEARLDEFARDTATHELKLAELRKLANPPPSAPPADAQIEIEETTVVP